MECTAILLPGSRLGPSTMQLVRCRLSPWVVPKRLLALRHLLHNILRSLVGELLGKLMCRSGLGLRCLSLGRLLLPSGSSCTRGSIFRACLGIILLEGIEKRSSMATQRGLRSPVLRRRRGQHHIALATGGIWPRDRYIRRYERLSGEQGLLNRWRERLRV